MHKKILAIKILRRYSYTCNWCKHKGTDRDSSTTVRFFKDKYDPYIDKIEDMGEVLCKKCLDGFNGRSEHNLRILEEIKNKHYGN